ncbi:MAG: hypothetical protein WC657_00465 [Candidatus Paceibacterota bacterium]|jgi:hypothetical protein
MILPSKKVLSILIITIALVGSIIITFGRDKSSQAINYASNLVAGEKVSIPENPNWQNELGSVAPPVQASSTSETETAVETTTDIVSKTLISNYLALKQNGNLDNTSIQKIVDQGTSLADQLANKIVLDTKLNIIPDNGKQSITDYGENLGIILKNSKPKEVGDELEILSTAISSKDYTKINELDSVILVYETVASQLEKMPVPKTFVKAHLDLTNSIKKVALALKETRLVFSDPMQSLLALQLYQEGKNTFRQAHEAIKAFIISNKIIYKQGSGGYYLLYGI